MAVYTIHKHILVGKIHEYKLEKAKEKENKTEAEIIRNLIIKHL